MTIQDLGSIGEFVAAIATLITLVYLALQIRQNSREVSRNTNSVLGTVELETTQHHSDWLLAVAQSPDLGRIWRLGISEPMTLSEDERVQFAMLIGSAFYGIEGPFRQHERGLLSNDSWEPMEALIRLWMRSPAVLEWWATRDVPFARSFSDYVDSQIPASSQSEAEQAGGSIWSSRTS